MADSQERLKTRANFFQDLSTHLTISRDQTSTSQISKEKLLALAKVASTGDKDIQQTSPVSGDLNDPNNLLENFDFDQFLQGDAFSFEAGAFSPQPPETPEAGHSYQFQKVESTSPDSSAAIDDELQEHQGQQFPAKEFNSSDVDMLGGHSSAHISSRKKRAGSLGTTASNGRIGADSPNEKEIDRTGKKVESDYILTHSSRKDVTKANTSNRECIDESNGHDPISGKSDSMALLESTGKGRPNANAPRHETDMSMSDLLRRLKNLERENLALKSKRPAKGTTWITFYRLENTTYLEPPQWRTAERGFILRADVPIRNEAIYLEQHPEIGFAVYKSYYSQPPPLQTSSDMQDGVLSAPEPYAESLKLISEHLISAVKKSSQILPEFRRLFPNFQPSQKIEIPAPYMFLYYAMPLLSSVEPSLTSNESHLLKKLVSCIRASHGKEYDDARRCFSEGVVTMRLMKYLVCPGDVLVYASDPAKPAFMSTTWASNVLPAHTNPRYFGCAYDMKYIGDFEASDTGDDTCNKEISEEHTSSQPHTKISYSCTVSAWTWVFDGFFRRKNEDLSIEMKVADKDEEVKIKSLNIFPLRFDDGEIGTRLKKRGEVFWKCRSARLVSYQEDEHTALTSMGDRYMIDIQTYKTLHPDSVMATSAFRADMSEEAMASNEPPEGNSIFLFPPTIIGYNLRLKRWVDLSVDRISEVVWNKKAFEDLVVNNKTKELVKALVTGRVAEESTDFIQGKGNGLILLLHGGPGTGKTFTAEGVAEMAEKPLYRVTCGDVGTKAEDVEKYLESVLHLGKIWDCVVLLDEADVFLEERSLADLERNALVSVFLRVLEYNVGILILTSNRVGSFDEAFKSRIQLALHYENLTISQQRKIWQNFLDRLQKLDEGKIDYKDIMNHIDDLGQQYMNGRQIRNAITIARQLARYQGKRLCYDHLKHVIEVGGEFETYLSNVREGFSDDEIKRDVGLR